jgi:hypothetical protein
LPAPAFPWVTNLVALLGSNLILLSAFLLQEDAGDGPSWVTITALLRGIGRQQTICDHGDTTP